MKKTLILFLLIPLFLKSHVCKEERFTATISNNLRIQDVLKEIATRCHLSIIVKDSVTKKILENPLYYIQVKEYTLEAFLSLILKEHDLNYSIEKDILRISYFLTRTFRIHYIAGQRVGKSNAHITIANSNHAVTSASEGLGRSRTGISIESKDSFHFWKTLSLEIERILSTTHHKYIHYTKKSDGWYDTEGKHWNYNPLTPIVNPEAGMVTVTGNSQQIEQVEKYIQLLSQQIKTQVLIDVKILSVRFEQGTTKGIDWHQLYKLQNINIEMHDEAIVLNGTHEVDTLIKFLATQGEVRTLSSPKVMTLNNQPALISVGKELFYKIKSKTVSHEGSSAIASEGETIDSVFAGILLDITPEINDNTEIILKINPSISDTVHLLEGENTTRSIPPDLIRRQISSVIKVGAGRQVVLGGLISSKEGKEIQKVPLLGDLPLLEHLFTHEKKTHTIEELVLIITPHLIQGNTTMHLKDLEYQEIIP